MPKLNEYLGSIISSLNTARVMADIQTVRVAEDYAKHELLQHFSVPRMRIDDVEITIPVAIDSAEEQIDAPVDIINNKDFNSQIYAEITRSLGVRSLPRETSLQVRSLIASETRELETSINKSRDLTPVASFSKQLAEQVSKVLAQQPELEKSASTDDLSGRLNESATSQLQGLVGNTSLGDMKVIAETHLLRDQKPEHIMQIKLKISEDAVEWQKLESADGEQKRLLLPE
ncbi:hypothetical protein [Oceanobacter mangrovi]|uniref:hypothetical protein n=1 Tax=Oceanobacter mangrovi TaxID=2862510 RepID=UPI001C8D75E0|nr:hypothetical protein [Oceanobacter mangrovi]